MLRAPRSFNVQDTTWRRLVPQSPRMFLRRPSSGGERQRSVAPRLPPLHPPHLQPASRRPPASGPRAPRAAVSSRPPPGDRSRRRARRGGPSPSGRGGSSQQQQQQRRPLTWKVTAEKEEEKEEEEEGEEEGEETPLVPLFSLPRRPLLAKAERVWWGVSGSISLRTEGGRAGTEGGKRSRPPAQAPLSFIYFSDTVRRWSRDRGRRAREGAARPGPQQSACGSRSGRLPSRSVDARGYSWQRLPEQKLLGGVRGEGGRGERRREGGRGRDSASDVIGSPSASQGGRPNQKNQSGAGERRGLCGATGEGSDREVKARPRCSRAPARSDPGISPESQSLLVMQKNLGVSRSLRISFRDAETSSLPLLSSHFPDLSSSRRQREL